MRTFIAFNFKQFICQFIKGTAVMHCMPMSIIPIFHISSISSFELSPKSASWDKMVDKTGFIFQSLVNFYHHGKETWLLLLLEYCGSYTICCISLLFHIHALNSVHLFCFQVQWPGLSCAVNVHIKRKTRMIWPSMDCTTAKLKTILVQLVENFSPQPVIWRDMREHMRQKNSWNAHFRIVLLWPTGVTHWYCMRRLTQA